MKQIFAVVLFSLPFNGFGQYIPLDVSTPPTPYFLAKARFLPLEQKSIYDKQSKAGYHVCQG